MEIEGNPGRGWGGRVSSHKRETVGLCELGGVLPYCWLWAQIFTPPAGCTFPSSLFSEKINKVNRTHLLRSWPCEWRLALNASSHVHGYELLRCSDPWLTLVLGWDLGLHWPCFLSHGAPSLDLSPCLGHFLTHRPSQPRPQTTNLRLQLTQRKSAQVTTPRMTLDFSRRFSPIHGCSKLSQPHIMHPPWRLSSLLWSCPLVLWLSDCLESCLESMVPVQPSDPLTARPLSTAPLQPLMLTCNHLVDWWSLYSCGILTRVYFPFMEVSGNIQIILSFLFLIWGLS